MKGIWKYTLKPDDLEHVVPKGGVVRHVDEQFGEICVWIEVDPDQPVEARRFEVYGTGHEISPGERTYLGTAKVQDGRFVFHVYEVGKEKGDG